MAAAAALCLVPAYAAAAPCSAPAYRQFDFFLGTWNVKDRAGKPLGTDVVTKRLNGCVIFEQWKDAGGPGRGFGISGFEPGRREWHQTFMDDGGLVLTLDGAPEHGAMRLRGADYPAKGKRLHEVTWVRRGAAVEEIWNVSSDGGAHWRTVFDGFFYRVSAS